MHSKINVIEKNETTYILGIKGIIVFYKIDFVHLEQSFGSKISYKIIFSHIKLTVETLSHKVIYLLSNCCPNKINKLCKFKHKEHI